MPKDGDWFFSGFPVPTKDRKTTTSKRYSLFQHRKVQRPVTLYDSVAYGGLWPDIHMSEAKSTGC
jgi:hypothetical protein